MPVAEPDLTVPLVGVLIRFRTNPVAICGDLQDMYHRVYVREEDRSVQRILWWHGEEVADYEVCVLTFGATCSPSLAQYVKNLNAQRFAAQYPKAVAAIVADHYVDDWLGGGRTEEEVVELARTVMCIHAEAGFVMHKIQSNSETVLQSDAAPHVFSPHEAHVRRFGSVVGDECGAYRAAAKHVWRSVRRVFDCRTRPPHSFGRHNQVHFGVS